MNFYQFITDVVKSLAGEQDAVINGKVIVPIEEKNFS